MNLRYEGAYRWFYITPPYLYETSYGAYYFVLEYDGTLWNLALGFNKEWVASDYKNDYNLRNIDLEYEFENHHIMFNVHKFSPYEKPEFDPESNEFDEQLLLKHADFYAARKGEPAAQNMVKAVLKRLEHITERNTSRNARKSSAMLKRSMYYYGDAGIWDAYIELQAYHTDSGPYYFVLEAEPNNWYVALMLNEAWTVEEHMDEIEPYIDASLPSDFDAAVDLTEFYGDVFRASHAPISVGAFDFRDDPELNPNSPEVDEEAILERADHIASTEGKLVLERAFEDLGDSVSRIIENYKAPEKVLFDHLLFSERDFKRLSIIVEEVLDSSLDIILEDAVDYEDPLDPVVDIEDQDLIEAVLLTKTFFFLLDEGLKPSTALRTIRAIYKKNSFHDWTQDPAVDVDTFDVLKPDDFYQNEEFMEDVVEILESLGARVPGQLQLFDTSKNIFVTRRRRRARRWARR